MLVSPPYLISRNIKFCSQCHVFISILCISLYLMLYVLLSSSFICVLFRVWQQPFELILFVALIPDFNDLILSCNSQVPVSQKFLKWRLMDSPPTQCAWPVYCLLVKADEVLCELQRHHLSQHFLTIQVKWDLLVLWPENNATELATYLGCDISMHLADWRLGCVKKTGIHTYIKQLSKILSNQFPICS